MKLCPLFESIELHWCYPRNPRERHLCSRTLEAANAKLPREAIEAAIDCMEMYGRHYSVDPYINEHIEQLRAMLPEGE